MKKKINREKKSLVLSLFGVNPPDVKVDLDPTAPKEVQDKYEQMNAGDTNCACE